MAQGEICSELWGAQVGGHSVLTRTLTHNNFPVGIIMSNFFLAPSPLSFSLYPPANAALVLPLPNYAHGGGQKG